MRNLLLKVILPLGAIIGMLAFITLFNPIKQSIAGTGGYYNMDVCGNLVALNNGAVTENPTCGTKDDPISNISSYQTSVTIENTAGYTISGNFYWYRYWCQYDNGQWNCGGPDDPVSHNGTWNTVDTIPFTLGPGEQKTISSGTTNNPMNMACGVYQNDFSFSYDNGKCTPGTPPTKTSPAKKFFTMNWGYCKTTNPNCTVAPTATPTQAPTATPTQPVATPTTPVATPTVTATPTQGPTATPSPTGAPTATPTLPVATPTSTTTNNCDNTTQIAVNGSNDNNNCNQNNNNNNNNNTNSQSQSQTQNNNQTVNITLGSGQQQQQQQVLAASTGPTTLPKTGAESDILFGLLALIPVGWKIRKLV